MPDRGGFDDAVQQIVAGLGARPRKAKLRRAIVELARLRAWRPFELAGILNISPNKLVERHLTEMVSDGSLERTHPDNPSHPRQAYRAVKTAIDES